MRTVEFFFPQFLRLGAFDFDAKAKMDFFCSLTWKMAFWRIRYFDVNAQ